MKIDIEEIRERLIRKLDTLSNRRSQRRLFEEDITGICTAIERHRCKFETEEENFDELEVVICGGWVPYKYKHKAETDIARVLMSKRHGRVIVEVGRHHAIKVSGGRPGFLEVVVRRPDELRGTIIEKRSIK